jgi:cell division transport system permease protein
VLYVIVRQRFDDQLGLLLGVAPTFLPWEVAVGMIAMGAILGAASAFAGVRRLSAV